jgi:HAD superfamily hydrolase (TIGR01450 family)
MTDNYERLSAVKCFILDMDGTIYLGNSLFPETLPFLKSVKDSGRDFMFFTNNSSLARQEYISKLGRMNIDIPPEKMLISTDVITDWLLKNRPGESAYVVGTPYLIRAFSEAGIAVSDINPDYVVLGFDTTLTYGKLVKACNFIRAGKKLYGVNPDLNCPVENGFIPDCGSIYQLIKASTGAPCDFFGKPSEHTLRYIVSHTGLKENEIAMVGDRMYTDIAVTKGTDVLSILVMSGETTPENISDYDYAPDLIFDSIGDMTDLL